MVCSDGLKRGAQHVDACTVGMHENQGRYDCYEAILSSCFAGEQGVLAPQIG